MKDDVATLEITSYELEKVCGREVNELLIGGLVGGVLRSSALSNPTKRLSFLVVEIAVSGLLLIFTLPVSFALARRMIELFQIAISPIAIPSVILTNIGPINSG